MKVGNMATAAFQKSRTDDQLRDAILNGVKTEKDGVKKEMDPYKDELSPDQVKALVEFIRALPTS
jgi:mono/diheme cytochrome c family protein